MKLNNVKIQKTPNQMIINARWILRTMATKENKGMRLKSVLPNTGYLSKGTPAVKKKAYFSNGTASGIRLAGRHCRNFIDDTFAVGRTRKNFMTARAIIGLATTTAPAMNKLLKSRGHCAIKKVHEEVLSIGDS